jgi:hypothetical protein
VRADTAVALAGKIGPSYPVAAPFVLADLAYPVAAPFVLAAIASRS